MNRKKNLIPLPELMRPQKIEEIVGQEEILAKGKPLRTMIDSDTYRSFILWGPPGSGKTTIAKLIENTTNHNFISYSAVQSGIKEVKTLMKQAKYLFMNKNISTILFVDEIHRFNKSQQDAFLPYVEAGYIILIGATTENPSFEVISALLSRTQVFVLKPLTKEQILQILKRSMEQIDFLLEEEILLFIASLSGGDARKALNYLDILYSQNLDVYSIDKVAKLLSKNVSLYDKKGEEHYNLISAFHKSIRGSDPQAALYWLARMLNAGEDPKFIARRLIRIASEDIGLADPNALQLAVSAMHAITFLGMPESDIILSEITIYLATSPKSNSVYLSYKKALDDAKNNYNETVPLFLRNAPTKLMKDIGYAKGYKYAHDFPNNYVYQKYFPENMDEREYYTPGNFGFEKEINKRIKWYNKLKENYKSDKVKS